MFASQVFEGFGIISLVGHGI
jgi:hypothetical protein